MRVEQNGRTPQARRKLEVFEESSVDLFFRGQRNFGGLSRMGMSCGTDLVLEIEHSWQKIIWRGTSPVPSRPEPSRAGKTIPECRGTVPDTFWTHPGLRSCPRRHGCTQELRNAISGQSVSQGDRNPPPDETPGSTF